MGDDIVQSINRMEERTKSIIIGSVLGDGHVTSLSAKNKARLWLKYDDQYFSYLEWLHDELRSIGVGPIKSKKGYHQHQFLTDASLCLGLIRRLFYPEGRKIVPRSIKEIFKNPLALAIWYQDGTLDSRSKDHFNSMFATHCFSFSDCALLAETLRDNFKLGVRVHRCQMRGKVRFRLYVTSQSMIRFLNLIRPYVNSCFEYKICK